MEAYKDPRLNKHDMQQTHLIESSFLLAAALFQAKIF